MLNQTPSWTTSDNKVHTNYLVALKHELTVMFSKAADNDVIAKKIVEQMSPPFIDTAVEIMQLIKAEINEPSAFEVIQVEKTPVTGIKDLPEDTSLGAVGDPPVEAPLELQADQVTDISANDAVELVDAPFHPNRLDPVHELAHHQPTGNMTV